MNKIDLKKEYSALYKPSASIPQIIDIPLFRYLMIDGIGIVGSLEFQQAIEALFNVSYKVKFTLKKNNGIDYTVMPLEGLWWADNMDDFIVGNKEKWQWTLMILQPPYVTDTIMQQAIYDTEKKISAALSCKLRFDNYAEGLSAQIMYIGPFSEEHATITKVHNAISEQGGVFDGKRQKHHEIYLSDFRRTAPEKLKTVIRQPFVIA